VQVFEPRRTQQDLYEAGAARYRQLYEALAETP
jgi:hypothetical protein